MKVEVCKWYLVEVFDDEKNDPLYSEFHCTNRKNAIRIGQKEKERLMKERKAQRGLKEDK